MNIMITVLNTYKNERMTYIFKMNGMNLTNKKLDKIKDYLTFNANSDFTECTIDMLKVHCRKLETLKYDRTYNLYEYTDKTGAGMLKQENTKIVML